jgi:hypothetical protein
VWRIRPLVLARHRPDRSTNDGVVPAERGTDRRPGPGPIPQSDVEPGVGLDTVGGQLRVKAARVGEVVQQFVFVQFPTRSCA